MAFVFRNLVFGIGLIFSSVLFSQSYSATSSLKKVVEIVNRERNKQGVKSVNADYRLGQVALEHAQDMYYNNYFSHQSLDGRTLGDRLKKGRINYKIAGENIARGQKTEVRVMQSWMNSPGHRRNILNKKFNKLGIARSGDVWVQVFSN